MSVERPVDRAMELASAARDDPASVDLSTLAPLLDPDAPEEARRYAIRAFRRADWVDSPDLDEFVASLRAGLDAEDALLRNAALQALADVAAVDVEPVRPAVDDAIARFDDDQELVRSSVTDLLRHVGREDPSALTPAVPRLLELLDATDPHRRRDAVYCLGHLAREDVGPLVPHVDRFVDVYATERAECEVDAGAPQSPLDADRLRESAANEAARRRDVRTVAGVVLVAVAEDDPLALDDHVDDVAAFLDAPDPQIQGVAVDVLEAVGREHAPLVEAHVPALAATLGDAPSVTEKAVRALTSLGQSRPAAVAEAVEPRVDAVVQLLDRDDPEVRALAAGVLTYLAEESPGAVEPALDRVRSLLGDDDAIVRGNAVWTLGFVDDQAAREELVEVRDADPDPDVRRAAENALELR